MGMDSKGGRAGWTLRAGLAALVLFVAGPLLAHFRVFAPLVGFGLFALGGLAALLTLLAGGLRAARGLGSRVELVPAAVTTAVFLFLGMSARGLPRINDITTDTENPPRFVEARSLPANRGRDLAYPGASFAVQQHQAYPDLGPAMLPVPVDEAFFKAEAAAGALEGVEITRVDRAAGAIEGVAISRVFRFADDFVVEVRARDGGSVVHVRSKSRDGKGDMGVNAQRIRALLARLR